MIKLKILIITAVLAFFCSHSHAQDNDSTIVLAFDDYLQTVIDNHPMSRQADIQEEMGIAELLQSRGAFDPKAFADIRQKYFDGSRYYSVIDGGVKLPTWFGLEFYAGMEQNDGAYLNPELSTPDAGLAYAGASLPIGQGLFIDRRRADLRKAQSFAEMSVNQRIITLNQLLLEASRVYWDWFNAYNNLKVYEEAVELAQVRVDAIKQSALLGDVPPIDTVEAGIQLQNRMLNLQQAQLEFKNTSAWLSVYLWTNGWIPVELNSNVFPPTIDNFQSIPFNDIEKDSIDGLLENHPVIRRSELKIEQLDIERRLKAEMLKPTLNLKYNALSEPINGNPFADYSLNNYRWGLSFNMPLFLRKERGALKLAKLKIEDKTLDLTVKRQAIEQKIIMSFNTWQTTVQQIDLYSRTVNDYQILLNGERSLFQTGESSLFMVNRRELGYINAKIKLVELYQKNQMSAVKTLYEMGILHEN